MKGKNLIIGVSIITIVALGLLLYGKHKKEKDLEAEIKEKEKDYFELMGIHLSAIRNNPTLVSQIVNQIKKIHKNYSSIRPDIANRLKEVLELINDKKEHIAIEKLTLIIENLLKEKYLIEEKGNKKKCPNLYGLLNSAKEKGWITSHQYNFSLFIKDHRNTEAHELVNQISENEKYIAFFAGIEIIYQLSGIKKVA